jgi:cytochrome c peroxidase
MALLVAALPGVAADRTDLTATKEDAVWLLPITVPYPQGNEPTAERVALGKKLFFDPRLSGDGNMACATCHNPSLGWSDGLSTARGFHSKVLGRATPTIYNAAYNSSQMWDGRKSSLEDQATGPLESKDEMGADFEALFKWLTVNDGYRDAFAKAYPGEEISKVSLAKAIASFERTVVSNTSPFDRWLRGDTKAMTAQQVNGFRVFANPAKGNCVACHQAPNFTDNGFHNIGLTSFGKESPDMGRFAQKPVAILKGAFKTSTLRNISQTAPYFHDGSVQTLMAVIEHYVRGGDIKTNLSPNMKPLNLTQGEKEDLVAFLDALSSEPAPFAVPVLP